MVIKHNTSNGQQMEWIMWFTYLTILNYNFKARYNIGQFPMIFPKNEKYLAKL